MVDLGMSITVGNQIGDYEIIGPLGIGGMGQVFQVRHTISHRIEAMKVLAPHRPVTDEMVGRFLREALMGSPSDLSRSVYSQGSQDGKCQRIGRRWRPAVHFNRGRF